MGDEEENDDIVGKEYPGGRVGLNCRVIKEPDQVVVEEINHGFINDGYDDYLYEDNGDYPLELSINLREDSPCREKAHSTRRRPSPGTVKLRECSVTLTGRLSMEYLHVISKSQKRRYIYYSVLV